jgi:hypothetical protein
MLAGCEMSGQVRDAFARLGWDAWSCDVLPSESPDHYTESGGSARHIQGDVLSVFLLGPPGPFEASWDLFVGFPPCTHLSQAGAVWWKHKDATRGGNGDMQEGAAFFMKMVKAPARYVAVENPVGIMGLPSQACYYRRPDQVVQPHMFGDPLVKATCIWLEHGLPPLYADNPVEPLPGGRVATGGGSWRTDQRHGRGPNNGHEDAKGRVNRQRERNRTLPGLARAMAEQWTKFIEEQEAAA